MIKPRIFVFLSLLSLAFGCTADPSNYIPIQITTPVVTSNLGDSVILPQVFKIDEKVVGLRAAVSNFILSRTNADLEIAQNAWREAHSFWSRGEAFLFGPAVDKKLAAKIDSFPVSPVDIETIITTSQVIGPDQVLSFDGSLKGFHALEYLLFGKDGAKKSSDFMSKECDYMSAVLQDMEKLTQSVRYSWDPARGDYIGKIKNPGSGGTYATDMEVLRDMLNSMIAVCNDLAVRKIGTPLAKSDAALEESHFSSNSKADYIDNLIGVLNMYQGGTQANSYGISGLVQQAGDYSLDGQVFSQIHNAISNLEVLSPSFAFALINDQASVETARQSAAILAETLASEVKPLLIQ